MNRFASLITTRITDMNNWIVLSTLLLLLASTVALGQQDEHGHADEEVVSSVELSADERLAADIGTAKVGFRGLSEQVTMPAEIVVNAYESASVTTRITAQVLERFVKLGDEVTTSQPLVRLSSVEMADAQGALIIADQEWQRVRDLGKAAVSGRRYVEAEIARSQALAKVLAYGMTAAQAEDILRRGAAALATGEFVLLAPQQGTVLSDAFITGELIEPGRVLFDISDESTLWVEASTVPSDLTHFEVGAPARIAHGDGHWINGRVIQLHHQLDETTRRQGLRIQVDNEDDHLHPGQFVEAEISTGEGPSVLAVPSEAITLIEGAPTVFLLEDDHELHPQPVETGIAAGGWTEIVGGLSEGDEIAVSGVFHIKSLLLKSSLGEGHAH
jgi:cobalt-zinc-cadmium efflux system membrane fusion protein